MFALLMGERRKLSVSPRNHWAELRRRSSLAQVQVLRGETMKECSNCGWKGKCLYENAEVYGVKASECCMEWKEAKP